MQLFKNQCYGWTFSEMRYYIINIEAHWTTLITVPRPFLSKCVLEHTVAVRFQIQFLKKLGHQICLLLKMFMNQTTCCPSGLSFWIHAATCKNIQHSRRSLEIYPSWATVAEQHGGFQEMDNDSQLQETIQYPDAKYTYSFLISKSNIFLISERML